MNAKRESSQLLSPAEALLYGMDDSKSRSSPKSKDKDKAGVMMGPNASAKDGSWRKVTSVLRDDGYLRLFSEVSRRSPSHDLANMLHDRTRSSCTRFTSLPDLEPTFASSTNPSSTVPTASSSTVERTSLSPPSSQVSTPIRSPRPHHSPLPLPHPHSMHPTTLAHHRHQHQRSPSTSACPLSSPWRLGW